MKGRMLCLSVVTAMFAYSANAQTRLTADVPFEFNAGNAKLPAGQYDIDRPLPNVIRLATSDRSVSAMILVNGTTRLSEVKDGKLIFNKYGNRHFLSNVWAPGAADGYELRRSSLEKEMIAQSAQPGTHVIAARQR